MAGLLPNIGKIGFSDELLAMPASLLSAMPLQGDMTDAQLPSFQEGSDAPILGGLSGLGLSITGNGVKLPTEVLLSDARDDKN